MSPPSPPTCIGLTGTNYELCEYIIAQGCGAAYYLIQNSTTGSFECVPYSSQQQKVSGALGLGSGPAPDTGNTDWQLISAALVMFQVPCVGFFYSGLAGETNVSNIILQCFTALCIVSFLWWAWGYTIMFGPGSPYGPNGYWLGLEHLGWDVSGAYGANMPHIAFVAFQCMFAAITPPIISGGMVGRMPFRSWCAFVAIWTTIVYDFYGRWIWAATLNSNYAYTPLGFMGQLGAVDFAGGTVIHITSGTAALACAIVIGPRLNKEKVRAHNVMLTVFGATILWFGWYGFNAGSATVANGLASLAGWNTHLATATAAASWMLCEHIDKGHGTPVGWAIGAVAGLVAITPACGFIMTWAAFLLGATVSPVCYISAKFVKHVGIDDTLDSFAIHAIGGAWGALWTGLFASAPCNLVNGAFYGNGIQFAYQLATVSLSMWYTFFVSVGILLILKFTIGIRSTEEEELAGLDVSEHGVNPAQFTKDAQKVDESLKA